MPHITSLEEFGTSCKELVKKTKFPDNFRYVMKYSHFKGELKVTATDDVKKWMYQSKSKGDLKKILKINLSVMEKILELPVAKDMENINEAPADDDMEEINKATADEDMKEISETPTDEDIKLIFQAPADENMTEINNAPANVN